jgi:uncharacterized membrane protein
VVSEFILNPMFQKILASFFRGLVLVAPVTITIYILVSALRYVDELLHIKFPGLGILILVSSITIIGALSKTLLINPLLGYLEKIITKVPLAALIYSSLKDLLSAFVGDKRKFDQPVLVELVPFSGVLKVGFITQKTLEPVLNSDYSAVYFPHSYNISGEVMLVPANLIQSMDWKSAEAMKFVVSGGVAFHKS